MGPHLVFLPGSPRNRGAWWATVHGVAKSWTQLRRQQLRTSDAEAWVSTLGGRALYVFSRAPAACTAPLGWNATPHAPPLCGFPPVLFFFFLL